MIMQIKEFSSYEFFENGSVYSYKTSRFLKPTYDLYGYLKISCIRDDGKRVTNGLHNWICRAFHGDPPGEKYEACHIDENKCNCCADNLIWETHINNINYGSRTIRSALSHRKPIQQFTLSGILIDSYKSVKEASEKTHISYDGIIKAVNGKTKTSGGFIWRYQ